MRGINSIWAAAVAAMLSALAVSADALGRERWRDRGDAAISGPGDYRFAFRHGGVSRQYLVHVPQDYDARRPTPMVLALHGGGGDMTYMARDDLYGLISKSEQAGFVVVFPNGYSRFRSGKVATWNAGNCCGASRDREIDDVGFLRAVIARVDRALNIDDARVYSIGMSNGAMMSYRLACEASDVVKGVAAIAGTDNTIACAPKTPTPILHIHARNDDHVLFDGGAGPSAANAAYITDFVSVPRTIAKWTAINRAEMAARRVLEVDGAWCELHAARGGGAPVQLCVTEEGGHSWPGGAKPRSSAPPSRAISANDVMWDFFSRR